MVEIFIPGPPQAKGRPKFAVRGGFARAYTPAKTRAYEELVAWHGKNAIQKPMEGPLCVEMIFGMPIPESTSKKRATALVGCPHTKKPDLDNLCKVVDGLNGIAWLDDSQIADLRAKKVYSETPGVTVKISTIQV